MNQFPTLSPFWQWQAAKGEGLSDALLKTFEKETKKRKFEQAVVGGYKTAERTVDLTTRASGTFFMESHHWMAGVLLNYAVHGNAQAQWGFTLTAPEGVQVTRYGLNEFYEYHTDSEPVSSVPFIRKVSVSICLTPATDYEGGEFEFDRMAPIKMDRGDILVFPSATLHRVKPVTGGERRSLVTWVLGPNLK